MLIRFSISKSMMKVDYKILLHGCFFLLWFTFKIPGVHLVLVPSVLIKTVHIDWHVSENVLEMLWRTAVCWLLWWITWLKLFQQPLLACISSLCLRNWSRRMTSAPLLRGINPDLTSSTASHGCKKYLILVQICNCLRSSINLCVNAVIKSDLSLQGKNLVWIISAQ